MSDDRWLEQITVKNQMQAVLGLNEYTKRFGVTLGEEDAKLILKEKNQTLKEQERIEFGPSIVPKLIQAFCDSPYIYQDNYVDTMIRLQEIFYLYKNESMDQMTDDELIEFMRKSFDGSCQGSLDYLEETALEHLARQIRKESSRFLKRSLNNGFEDESYDEEEEEDDEY